MNIYMYGSNLYLCYVVTALDPVFFMERARTSWGRNCKPGTIRVQGNPSDYKKKMLTSLGHPGVY